MDSKPRMAEEMGTGFYAFPLIQFFVKKTEKINQGKVASKIYFFPLINILLKQSAKASLWSCGNKAQDDFRTTFEQ